MITKKDVQKDFRDEISKNKVMDAEIKALKEHIGQLEEKLAQYEGGQAVRLTANVVLDDFTSPEDAVFDVKASILKQLTRYIKFEMQLIDDASEMENTRGAVGGHVIILALPGR